MAERNVSPVEKNVYYICIPCARVSREPRTEFLYVSSLEFPFTCEICEQQFQHGLLAKRINPNNAPTHRCSACDETFQRPSELFSHSMGHSGDWEYRCEYCYLGFYSDSYREIHLIQRSLIRDLTCVRCLRPFLGKSCPNVYSDLVRLNKIFCGDCCIGSKNIIEYVTQ
ncbi:hypothetical protein TNIN_497911 [Trichonephila inaurata madagascariensis]|uniref:C2H2-type domain-containing protein n=1 Tax=Trichonephila inaurata madagascariensis TaxID=2747483 RepID=A0A8X6WZ45_9ARAC|nr:hypothetical protein TNIN_497911 [Trichonephila inaurata madagascariensis]